MTDLHHCRLVSPIGPLTLIGDVRGLHSILFPRDGEPATPPMNSVEDPRVFKAAMRQLEEYFAGARQTFSLALLPAGTPFQLEVWQALQTIPFAETESYAGLARRIGRPRAVRAVGAANGRNPLPIVIPCHRVIGANGSLTGFAGGLAAKDWLLRHEAGQHSHEGGSAQTEMFSAR